MEKEENVDKYQRGYHEENEDGSSVSNIKRESESMDDFEHVERVTPFSLDGPNVENNSNVMFAQLVDVPRASTNLIEIANKLERDLLDTTVFEPSDARILQPVPATPPPSADFEKCDDTMSSNAQSLDLFSSMQNQVFQANVNTVNSATMAFIETEKSESYKKSSLESNKKLRDFDNFNDDDTSNMFNKAVVQENSVLHKISPNSIVDTAAFSDESHTNNFEGDTDYDNKPMTDMAFESEHKLLENNKEMRNDIYSEVESTVFPTPQNPQIMTFLSEDTPLYNAEVSIKEAVNESCNIAPVKSLPPLPTKSGCGRLDKNFGIANEFSASMTTQRDEVRNQQSNPNNDTGDSEFESEPEPSPIKNASKPETSQHVQFHKMRKYDSYSTDIKIEEEIAPRKIFSDIGLDAWFIPERLHPKVAALIYWREPEITGIVFGVIMGILLSLAYWTLISVFSYVALLTLMGTMSFRIYKTIMQAVQKTSDGHPFKDILELDLMLPTEKVHEVADVAVAYANAAVTRLRRLFLVEDFVDSLKFGVYLWVITFVGSIFNGMTLIIIGVVALFTLPKAYETNKAQIDQNLALVHGKINELTAKVKAAIPLGKKVEAIKEE